MTTFLGRFVLVFLALGLATRLYITWSLPDVPAWVWVRGLASDLFAAAMVAGFAVLILLVRSGALRLILTTVLAAVLLIVAAAETFYWIEFESRLDRLVFHYLAYPVEVLVFLDEQFYLTWVGIPFIAFCVLVAWVLAPPHVDRLAPVAAVVAVAVVVALFARQSIVDPSRHLNQAASNGYLGVLTAALQDVEDADALFPPADGDVPAPNAYASPPVPAKHVVLIIEESMAGPYWVDQAHREQVFPNFMALAREGVLFENAYATGTRTTRGMEAILNGFPPLPGISATERPGFERLPSLARALREGGFRTVFAYGGWPDFSNFTNYWRGTGFERTTSRDDFDQSAYMTSWGASDDDLFRSALALMDEETGAHDRVFMSMLTVSHHRPFELPPASRFSGGRSAKHALQYADAALGRYFDAARTKPWFDDTLFVVVADHGPRTSGEKLIPVDSYRVPLLLLMPGELEPAVEAAWVSTMSVPATVANLLGVAHNEPFWGADLFAANTEPLPVEHDYHVGWIADGALRVLSRDGDQYAWRLHDHKLTNESGPGNMAAYFRAAHAAFYEP